MKYVYIVLGIFILSTLQVVAEEIKNPCLECHTKLSPLQVSDWQASKHFKEGIACIDCHSYNHKNEKDFNLVEFPTEKTCSECHEDKFNEFQKGKHSHGYKSLNAVPITHLEPDELMEGEKGCGGCHSIGIKDEKELKDLQARGYKYSSNACDSCHTRHSFSKKEATNPKACQKCHMGYDHPQYEMWESSKHGTRFLLKEKGALPENAAAPSCQFCHLPNGTHINKTRWGFLAVRLPLSENKEDRENQITILKALGVLNPETGEKTERAKKLAELDMFRLTEEDFLKEKKLMDERCLNCHTKGFVEKQFEYGDSMIKKSDKMMADAINVVAKLYKDKVLEKPAHYSFNYPDLLYFKKTSYIEQVLFRMYMKYRMRTYQGVFHSNPDYAYWYGWAAMTKSLEEIKLLDKELRALKVKNVKK